MLGGSKAAMADFQGRKGVAVVVICWQKFMGECPIGRLREKFILCGPKGEILGDAQLIS